MLTEEGFIEQSNPLSTFTPETQDIILNTTTPDTDFLFLTDHRRFPFAGARTNIGNAKMLFSNLENWGVNHQNSHPIFITVRDSFGSNCGTLNVTPLSDGSWRLGEIFIGYPERDYDYLDENSPLNDLELRGKGYGTELINTMISLAELYGAESIHTEMSLSSTVQFWEEINLEGWLGHKIKPRNTTSLGTQGFLFQNVDGESQCTLIEHIFNYAKAQPEFRQFFDDDLKRLNFYKKHGFQIVGVELYPLSNGGFVIGRPIIELNLEYAEIWRNSI